MLSLFCLRLLWSRWLCCYKSTVMWPSLSTTVTLSAVLFTTVCNFAIWYRRCAALQVMPQKVSRSLYCFFNLCVRVRVNRHVNLNTIDILLLSTMRYSLRRLNKWPWRFRDRKTEVKKNIFAEESVIFHISIRLKQRSSELQLKNLKSNSFQNCCS